MKKKRFLVWRDNSRLSFEQAVISHKSFTVEEVAVILYVYNVYSACFDWATFQLLRIGDAKYTFTFQSVAGCFNSIKVEVI